MKNCSYKKKHTFELDQQEGIELYQSVFLIDINDFKESIWESACRVTKCFKFLYDDQIF